jgi:hypothetical protein
MGDVTMAWAPAPAHTLLGVGAFVLETDLSEKPIAHPFDAGRRSGFLETERQPPKIAYFFATALAVIGGTPRFHSFQWATTSLMNGAEAVHRLLMAGTKPPEPPSGPHPQSECQADSPG